ncbi:MAG: glycosyltransferase family 2 protein [Candidatus Dojkabacteria bacterium]
MNKKAFSAVDVVIVTRNRPRKLLNCVRSLISNSIIPKRIVIIDSSSIKDNQYQAILARIRTYCHQKKISLVYKSTNDKGIAFARNLGIGEAKSELFAFIDDDEEAPINWIESILSQFNKENLVVLCGTNIPKYPNNYWNKIWKTVMNKMDNLEGVPSVIPTSNSSYLTSFIHDNKILFDERMKRNGEEEKFSEQIHYYKKKVLYTKKLFVYHDFRLSFAEFFIQWFSYGQGCVFRYKLNLKDSKKNYGLLQLSNNLLQFIRDTNQRIESTDIESSLLYPGIFIKFSAFWLGFLAGILGIWTL